MKTILLPIPKTVCMYQPPLGCESKCRCSSFVAARTFFFLSVWGAVYTATFLGVNAKYFAYWLFFLHKNSPKTEPYRNWFQNISPPTGLAYVLQHLLCTLPSVRESTWKWWLKKLLMCKQGLIPPPISNPPVSTLGRNWISTPISQFRSRSDAAGLPVSLSFASGTSGEDQAPSEPLCRLPERLQGFQHLTAAHIFQPFHFDRFQF